MSATHGQVGSLRDSPAGGWRDLHGPALEILEDDVSPIDGLSQLEIAERAVHTLPTVVILSGGRGARLQEHTRRIPKPLVEVGGRPIVWHVMRIYMAQGFRRFLLLTGYKADLIQDYVARQVWPAGVEVACEYTGEDTPTGGRLARAAAAIEGESFCVTYADGVADIDLGALLTRHTSHAAAATMTVVQPKLQYGIAVMDGDDLVSRFVEKPRCEHWINGGFFCFERSVLDLLEDDDVLENEPLERLAAEGQLRAFRHHGYWSAMDTYKDVVSLDNLWTQGAAPWKRWD